jgi:hypothetical protein
MAYPRNVEKFIRGLILLFPLLKSVPVIFSDQSKDTLKKGRKREAFLSKGRECLFQEQPVLVNTEYLYSTYAERSVYSIETNEAVL